MDDLRVLFMEIEIYLALSLRHMTACAECRKYGRLLGYHEYRIMSDMRRHIVQGS